MHKGQKKIMFWSTTGFTFEAAGNSKQEHWWWCGGCPGGKRQGGDGDGYSKT